MTYEGRCQFCKRDIGAGHDTDCPYYYPKVERMNRHCVGVLLILAGVLAVCLVPGAQACEPRTVYVAPAKKIIVQEYIAAAVLVPYVVQVQVPAYSVGYDYQGVQQQQLLTELQQLRQEVARLRVPANAVPSPLQPPQDTPKPQTNSLSRGQRGLAVLAQRCAVCHDQGVSEAKGGKHVFFQGGKLIDADKNAGPMLEQMDLGKMPKGSKLSDADFGLAVWALTVREDAPKGTP